LRLACDCGLQGVEATAPFCDDCLSSRKFLSKPLD
jgi:hypothetical protein